MSTLLQLALLHLLPTLQTTTFYPCLPTWRKMNLPDYGGSGMGLSSHYGGPFVMIALFLLVNLYLCR
ncbi:hypothetical protein E2C01_099357 [Portunus trituberculatus]|uniref:Uncharacterized protein n=1 Tax=Portunus trituberculatus TaxID=210409 RepID=A0A5B7KEP6_PORTR|nr:hypothetical protein [Portunus trituberculatus]